MKNSKVSTPWMVVGGVIAAHVVVGAALMIQGCGTTGPVTPPPEPKMPAVAQPQQPPAPVLNEPAPQLPVAGPEAKAPPSDTTVYVVEKGDSLSLICKRFHVDKAEVMALNRIKDVNKIRVGQKLVLPGKINVGAPKPVAKAKTAAAKPGAAKSASVHAAAPGGAGTYVVKAGDSLAAIAKHHKTTVNALRQANSLKGDRIVVGRKLVIPGASATAAPAAPAVPAAPVVPAEVAPAPAAPAAPDAAPPSEFDEMKKAPAPAAASAPAPASASAREHTVEQGEDLYTVAMTFGVSVNELKAANGLTDTTVAPGTRLKIPAAQ